MTLTNARSRVRALMDMVKIEHTVFALPFALISLMLAARNQPGGLPTVHQSIWVVGAMLGARTAAMTFNRIVDRGIDGLNPRTSGRHLPSGSITGFQAWAFFTAALALFLVSAAELNPLCLLLSPLALVFILGYSFTKRFTALCHLILGFGIGIAPVGAWIAVTGRLDTAPLLLCAAVTLWIGGFDVIYSLQDFDHDISQPLFSLPKRLGIARALTVSRIMHAAMLVVLYAVGVICHLHVIYFAGVLIVAGLIIWEQTLVRPDDLSRVNVAFFTMNGWVSVSLLLFVMLDSLARG